MIKKIIYLLSFIFFISGCYFYINQDLKEDIVFSNEEANIVSKGMLPMLVEESGIQIIYENPVIVFSDNNTLINLDFEVRGFSLILNGNAKFNSELITKDNKIYISKLNYKDFNLINKIEKSSFSDVFINKYNDFIKNKTIEELSFTFKRKDIYNFNNTDTYINNFKINKNNLIININKHNEHYSIYYIICFILSIILFILGFVFNNKK